MGREHDEVRSSGSSRRLRTRSRSPRRERDRHRRRYEVYKEEEEREHRKRGRERKPEEAEEERGRDRERSARLSGGSKRHGEEVERGNGDKGDAPRGEEQRQRRLRHDRSDSEGEHPGSQRRSRSEPGTREGEGSRNGSARDDRKWRVESHRSRYDRDEERERQRRDERQSRHSGAGRGEREDRDPRKSSGGGSRSRKYEDDEHSNDDDGGQYQRYDQKTQDRRHGSRGEREAYVDDHRRGERRSRTDDDGRRIASGPPADIPKDMHSPGDSAHAGKEDVKNAADAASMIASSTPSEQFVWKKKNEKLKKLGQFVEEDENAQAQRRIELQRELQKAKQRRNEREQEHLEWEEEQARLAREKEAEENADWEFREEIFHATNFYMKQAVRFREHRPTPADYCARNLRLDLEDVAADKKPPYDTIEKVNADRLREIIDQINEELRFLPLSSIEVDDLVGEKYGEPLREEYWTCLKFIAVERLQKLDTGAPTSGVHQSVETDVENMLVSKDYGHLDKMQREIGRTLEDGDEIDVEYWENVLDRVKYHKARARLNEVNKCLIEYKEQHKHAEPVDASETGEAAAMPDDEEMLRKERNKGMREDEQKFSEEVAIDRSYNWNDKYKPRKPKYFNRVHTGYEWNKYNQTHYDHDNPPPKTVQGYKFNVFYPDLIDKSKAPTFKIEKTDNPDVCIIRFVAGPPYEDVAFKIVNREWEHSHKKGFRCTYERGILHLWVNFKRMRYRR